MERDCSTHNMFFPVRCKDTELSILYKIFLRYWLVMNALGMLCKLRIKVVSTAENSVCNLNRNKTFRFILYCLQFAVSLQSN